MEPTGTTSSYLKTASTSQQVIDLIHSLYDTHANFRETLNSAYVYLSCAGLIYPDLLLNLPPYKDFLSVPPSNPGDWPHRPVAGSAADSADQAHDYPKTGIEQQLVMDLRYPPGTPPAAFLVGTANGGGNATNLSASVWTQTVSKVLDASNYDLDADRGPLHPCWTTGSSINDSPVDVVNLNYPDT